MITRYKIDVFFNYDSYIYIHIGENFANPLTKMRK